ncbi:hypothetical protein RB620_13975 [Paenibacillus sp. LHD-117]|nr:hypothetical protein [Paenibacillus sp. LHD-117]MDQ6420533.1 hypothetical protein [Paenibacillus sp. LHD-117]
MTNVIRHGTAILGEDRDGIELGSSGGIVSRMDIWKMKAADIRAED